MRYSCNATDNRCPHGVMWGDRTDVIRHHADGTRNYARMCWQCEAQARLDTIHVTSATAVVGDDGDVYLAMCGEPLGAYGDVAGVHPVGNYIGPDSCVFATVTCQPCRDRVIGRTSA